MEAIINNDNYVRVYDRNFVCKGIIDTYESCAWNEKYYEAGDFQLVVYPSEEMLNLLKRGYYLRFRDSDYVMIIESLEITSDIEEGNRIKVTGRSLESILERRIIYPMAEYDTALESAITSMVSTAFCTDSDVKRRISNFVVNHTTDSRILAKHLTAQYTGDNIYTIISALCKEHGIGFRIRLNDRNQFIFSLYMGADRSYGQDSLPYVVFSPGFDNLYNSRYLETDVLLKTMAYVYGDGEGYSRKRYTIDLSNGTKTGLDRRELYVDARDISSIDEDDNEIPISEYNKLLDQRGREKLAENEYSVVVDGKLIDNMTYVYGRDYKLGDIVQVENEYGKTAKSRIVEFVRYSGADGYTECPSFATI